MQTGNSPILGVIVKTYDPDGEIEDIESYTRDELPTFQDLWNGLSDIAGSMETKMQCVDYFLTIMFAMSETKHKVDHNVATVEIKYSSEQETYEKIGQVKYQEIIQFVTNANNRQIFNKVTTNMMKNVDQGHILLGDNLYKSIVDSYIETVSTISLDNLTDRQKIFYEFFVEAFGFAYNFTIKGMDESEIYPVELDVDGTFSHVENDLVQFIVNDFRREFLLFVDEIFPSNSHFIRLFNTLVDRNSIA